jgi:hypothetical protein
MKPKPGDTVVYIGKHKFYDSARIGCFGRLTYIYEEQEDSKPVQLAQVDWFAYLNHGVEIHDVYLNNIAKVEESNDDV